jgi:hypothetical protein
MTLHPGDRLRIIHDNGRGRSYATFHRGGVIYLREFTKPSGSGVTIWNPVERDLGHPFTHPTIALPQGSRFTIDHRGDHLYLRLVRERTRYERLMALTPAEPKRP